LPRPRMKRRQSRESGPRLTRSPTNQSRSWCGSKAISSSRRSSACRLPCRSPIAIVAMMPVLLVCHCPCITAASTARRRIDVLSPRVQRPTWFVRHAAGCHKKTGTNAGFLRAAGRRLSLLDLRLLEDHVLACLGIVFLHFQLVGRISLVLVCGVEKARVGSGYHPNLFTHQTFSPRARISLST